MIFRPLYFPAFLILNALMYFGAWGSAYLSIIIVMTYFVFRPISVVHPNNIVFAFFSLYVVVPSSINLILSAVGWQYVLPGGQQVFWDEMSKYTLFQAEFTFIVIFFCFKLFIGKERTFLLKNSDIHVNVRLVLFIFALNIVLVALFLQATGGLAQWVDNYGGTYLSGRAGSGGLNYILITVGNVLVFCLGVWVQRGGSTKILPISLAVVSILLQSFVGGFKGRFFILSLFFFAPWLVHLRLSLKTIFAAGVSFFVLLYLTTFVRTGGFYANSAYFLEMLINYFNAYQLHDFIVTSRDPGIFQTTGQIFTKPLQVIGKLGSDADFDLSVMLTKEFFPDHWYRENATQQWPIDTDLYLNFYGFLFSWIPLAIFAFILSRLYKAAVSRENVWFMPIFTAEFIRLFSMLRSTIIPWDIFIIALQYPAIYLVAKYCLRVVGSKGASK